MSQGPEERSFDRERRERLKMQRLAERELGLRITSDERVKRLRKQIGHLHGKEETLRRQIQEGLDRERSLEAQIEERDEVVRKAIEERDRQAARRQEYANSAEEAKAGHLEVEDVLNKTRVELARAKAVSRDLAQKLLSTQETLAEIREVLGRANVELDVRRKLDESSLDLEGVVREMVAYVLRVDDHWSLTVNLTSDSTEKLYRIMGELERMRALLPPAP